MSTLKLLLEVYLGKLIKPCSENLLLHLCLTIRRVEGTYTFQKGRLYVIPEVGTKFTILSRIFYKITYSY